MTSGKKVFGEPVCLLQEGDLWVFSKPSGMCTHPAHGEEGEDLLAWARRACGAPASLAPVHRLDRETSGLVMCSADPEQRGSMSLWFRDGEVNKTYLALVYGETRTKGTINRALADARRGKPLEAVTRYKRLEVLLERASLLRVTPETGRKHQIRRHLQGIGHSIVGDTRYPPPRWRALPGFPGRLWLHALEMNLPDGRTLEAPLSEELVAHLRLLRGDQEEQATVVTKEEDAEDSSKGA
ncbi:MAG: RluA family pseudouridine synthase [Myxococcales bacterium]|nr:RluA family pseudouridine synthase [Myxococcales bacterium]MCB9642562.1 RluA family pseudouridine synthase [Myxococcales bacterium]